ncbi:MAG: 23S rRNA (guanosine(2251)-2'-O)-methyltransferase RlmB [Elusimicrobia bacterium]|nr:23S rRNA (guanosine(2251)-2'-O)-methyltransferase RlmB [Elusimicrobiota bacterium]
MDEIISGRNAVREILRLHRVTVNKLYISQTARGSAVEEIITLAREQKIPIHHVPAEKTDALSPDNNQGVVAEIAAGEYLELDELWNSVKDKPNPLLVLLDGIEDPHNLGAIIRNAVAFGAHGIIVGKWRCATVTNTVLKTSAGASEHIPIARVTNIAETVSTLKDWNIWVIGTDQTGSSMAKQTFGFPLCIVIGSEGEGMHRLVKERCDAVVAIPQTGAISSLNASCASAVILYEIFRRNQI